MCVRRRRIQGAKFVTMKMRARQGDEKARGGLGPRPKSKEGDSG